MDINVPADQNGRYAIDSLKGDVFKAALDFGTNDSTQPGVEASQLASAAMLTEPLNDQHITEPRPTMDVQCAQPLFSASSRMLKTLPNCSKTKSAIL